ncbi:FecCD family ABC transporter permease [Thalassobius sp. S69A]|uniref:FecCD family ABC transporter permease n=1 Tax=unclassified Thalassovita TaxID=2619711 RepID=UPI000C122807|nr:iron ABC transporter [Paracoccaceae bacterium]
MSDTACSVPLGGRASLRLVLLALLVVAMIGSVSTGASGVSPLTMLGDYLSGAGISARDHVVLMNIRLPRLAMGLLVGAALAVSGAVMQGLFRNPLADPGIVGVSTGAAFGAVSAIVLGGMLPAALLSLGQYIVPVAAFLGAWGAVVVLYRIATRGGQTSVVVLLLAGIALSALAAAATGVLVYMADDQQLRDLTYWQMGSLAGANWSKLTVGALLILPTLLLVPRLARGLNALTLGEAAAAHMGTDIQRLKRLAILGVAVLAGASVAMAGVIGFVGIIVPHLLRICAGPDHERLLVDAAILGAALLVGADMIARLILAPAELPIGIVTAFLGAPVFLWILLRRRSFGGI